MTKRSCANCLHRAFMGWDGMIECCMWYEMATTKEEEEKEATDCERYEYGTPLCLLRDDEYCPSATAGDYGPSNPWDAPGMNVRDFI